MGSRRVEEGRAPGKGNSNLGLVMDGKEELGASQIPLRVCVVEPSEQERETGRRSSYRGQRSHIFRVWKEVCIFNLVTVRALKTW